MTPARRGFAIVALMLAGVLCAPCWPAHAAGPECGPGRFTVALDVGHTLSQPGATSARGVPEFEYNRRLAQALFAGLGRAGVAAVLIGAEGTPMQLQERTRLAQAARADLLLSLHHDSVQPHYLTAWTIDGQAQRYSDVFRGYSVFVSAQNARARDSQGVGGAFICGWLRR